MIKLLLLVVVIILLFVLIRIIIRINNKNENNSEINSVNAEMLDEYELEESETGKIIPMKMPYKYVIESFCDMLGASKAYNPKAWEP